MEKEKQAIVTLEDGTFFKGISFGADGEKCGKFIFTTGVVGYQELVTDPANAGKILIFTYPLIGNYGCAPKFNESKGTWAEGVVIKEKSRIFSNWQAKQSFDDFAKESGLIIVGDIDTRTLAVHLREKGEMSGIISTFDFNAASLSTKIKKFRSRKTMSLLPKISVDKITSLAKGKKGAKKIVVLDLGITGNIIRQLETLGFALITLPYNTSWQKILSLKADGLIVSGGPEEDVGLKEVVANIKELIKKIPILGISTGHQVLAMSLGAKINKMRSGHHGSNYPICGRSSYKGEITVQNHSYSLDSRSLEKIKDVNITYYNLNDRTPEEIESRKLKIIGVQYYPVSPGFKEVNSVFKRFSELL